MRSVKIAIALLFITLGAVIINSITLRAVIQDISDMVEEGEEDDLAEAYTEYSVIFDYFKKKEGFISLTVNHEDLTSVEDGFSELIGAAKAGDAETLITVKSRLINSLEHIRRLAGINLDSIL